MYDLLMDHPVYCPFPKIRKLNHYNDVYVYMCSNQYTFTLYLYCIIGKYVVLASLCFAAVLRPSVQGGIYFIVFLSAATWWACYKELGKAFAIVLRIIMVLVVCHICCLYAYHFDWTQEALGNTSYVR